MTDIPKEIINEANRVAHEALTFGRSSDGAVWVRVSQTVIARALMARDQRAAEIAREAMEDLWEDGCVRTFPASPETIAARILTYTEEG